MPFQIKDFNSITLSQINHARAVTQKLTDFQPGSVARTLLEAPAIEIEELYMQFFLGLRDAIPVATFLSFGFDRLPSAVARGHVSVSLPAPRTESLLIPSGTAFSTADGRIYLSSAAVTWATGSSLVYVPVEASAAGIDGNVAAGVIVSSSFFDGSHVVSNSAITTGRDAETDSDREARFAEFVQSLSRGTVVACEFATRSAKVVDADGNIGEYVTRVGVLENPGHVQLFLYSSGGLPSAALLTEAQRRLDGWRDDTTGEIVPGFRSAGVRVDALAMTERVVAAEIGVGMLPGYTLTPTVEQRLRDVFETAIRGALPGETLHVGTLVELLLAVSGVRTIVPDINANIVCGVDEALIPGTLSIAAL